MQQILFGIVHASNAIAWIIFVCCVIAGAVALYCRQRDRPNRRWLHTWLVVASVSLVFFGVGEGIWHYGSGFVPVPPPSSGPPHCVRATITIPGSTALYTLAVAVAANYMHYCNAIHIPAQIRVVDTGGSETGISDVESDTVGTLPLAASDCVCIGDSDVVATTFGGRYSNLDDHVIAAVQYVLVVDSSLGITNLTTDEIKNIYENGGTYSNWSQVNFRINLPIEPISRDTSSGTGITFEQNVLDGGSQKPPLKPEDQVNNTDLVMQRMLQVQGGIGYVTVGTALAYQTRYPGQFTILDIDGHPYSDYYNNSYTFWALEHMYTNSARASDSNPSYQLAQAFIDYMGNTDTIPNIIHNLSFLTVGDVSNILYTHY